MKIQLQQDNRKEETEVTIIYPKMDECLGRMIQEIRQYECQIAGHKEKRSYKISLENILYFDCTEGRTFFYTKDETYESTENLSVLERKLGKTSVIRIQKNCLMNAKHLKCVSPNPNHRLLAELSNGEKIIVSRKYVEGLKDLGKRGLL